MVKVVLGWVGVCWAALVGEWWEVSWLVGVGGRVRWFGVGRDRW